MKNINTFTVVGRLTKDAALKDAGAVKLLEFSLASNYSIKEGDNWVDAVNYFDCQIWGRRAEALAQYMIKGKKIVISGEMRQQRWTDKTDGKARSKIVLNVSDLELTDSKGSSSEAPNMSGEPE